MAARSAHVPLVACRNFATDRLCKLYSIKAEGCLQTPWQLLHRACDALPCMPSAVADAPVVQLPALGALPPVPCSSRQLGGDSWTHTQSSAHRLCFRCRARRVLHPPLPPSLCRLLFSQPHHRPRRPHLFPSTHCPLCCDCVPPKLTTALCAHCFPQTHDCHQRPSHFSPPSLPKLSACAAAHAAHARATADAAARQGGSLARVGGVRRPQARPGFRQHGAARLCRHIYTRVWLHYVVWLHCAALHSAPFRLPAHRRRANVWLVCRLTVGLAMHGCHTVHVQSPVCGSPFALRQQVGGDS
eukprot:366454-Chlamydomonas_euryale.AAC.21